MKVRFSAHAAQYLRQEHAYLARFNKTAAKMIVHQIRQSAKMLAEYPAAGLVIAPISGVRRYVNVPYHLDYVVMDDVVLIVAIRHGRQQEATIDLDEDELEDPDTTSR